MLDQRHRSQWEGRSLRSCHSLTTLGITYPYVAVVNSLPSQDVMWYGANPTISCPSSPSVHSQITPSSSIYDSYFSSAMLHAKKNNNNGLQLQFINIACNAVTRMKAALQLAGILATASDRCSKTGPWSEVNPFGLLTRPNWDPPFL